MKTCLILYKNALSSKYTAHEISLMFRELASKHCDIPIQKLYFLEDIDLDMFLETGLLLDEGLE
jgi:hypothetical protein